MAGLTTIRIIPVRKASLPKRASGFTARLLLGFLLLLQFSGVNRLIPQNPLVAVVRVCHGNHAECGCAPEAVAAGTCCCASSTPDEPESPSCCPVKEEVEEEHCDAANDQDNAVTIRNAPCGKGPGGSGAPAEAFEFALLGGQQAVILPLIGKILPENIPVPPTPSIDSLAPPPKTV